MNGEIGIKRYGIFLSSMQITPSNRHRFFKNSKTPSALMICDDVKYYHNG